VLSRRSPFAAALVIAVLSCRAATAPDLYGGEPLGTLLSDVRYSLAMGWNGVGTEFIEAHQLGDPFLDGYARRVVALTPSGARRQVTLFPVLPIHTPLAVVGAGLYVRAATGQDWHLVRYPLGAGTRDTLAYHVGLGSIAVSADERYVAYTSSETIVGVWDSVTVLDRHGGPVRGFRIAGGGHLLGLSPDGSLIAFRRAAAPAPVIQRALTTGAETMVVTPPAPPPGAHLAIWGQVAWRPAGARVAYTVASASAVDLWIVREPGATPSLLASAPPGRMLRGTFVAGRLDPLAWMDGGDRILILETDPAGPRATVGVVNTAGGGFIILERAERTTAQPAAENTVASAAPNLNPTGTLLVLRGPGGTRVMDLP
jgi:hypothetical protein